MTVAIHKIVREPPSPWAADGKLIPLRSDVHMLKGEHAFPIWGATVPNQYGGEHVCDPALWKHVALQLRQRSANCPSKGDLIRVTRADGLLDALFRIEDATAGYSLSFYCGRLPEQDAT